MKKPQPSTFSLSMAPVTLSSGMRFALDPLIPCTSNTHYSKADVTATHSVWTCASICMFVHVWLAEGSRAARS